MNIKKLWERFKFPKCENCKKDCQGHLNYENLCANLNYLSKYAEQNYEKNKESFEELQKIVKDNNLNIFSFGCGLGLDYIGAKEIFGDEINYYGIDECNWAIKQTNSYLRFDPKLPKTIKYDDGLFLLSLVKENVVLCFFNSLFTISKNSNLMFDLIKVLETKNKFYIVCDYTINNNFHLPTEEDHFLNELIKKLNKIFKFKSFEILDGKGIIIVGVG